MDRHGQIAQIDHKLVVPRVPPPHELCALFRLQFLARAQLIERPLLDEQRGRPRRCASCNTTYVAQRRVYHSETAPSLMATRRGVLPTGKGRGSAEGTRSCEWRESCWRGKKACVRSTVRKRCMGGGARSRAMSHWTMGNIPGYDLRLEGKGGMPVERESTDPINPNVRVTYCSFASFGTRELVGQSRTRAPCLRRARVCRIGTRQQFGPIFG